MEERVVKLEEFAMETRDRLARIETRLDQMATKGDLRELESTMVKWIVGTVGALGVAGITVMTFVLNNAVPKAPPLAAPVPPIIISVPGAAAVPSATPRK